MKYKRNLIQINRDTAILLHILKKKPEHSWEDIYLIDHDEIAETEHLLYKNSAKKFIEQFEGEDCILFIKELRDYCNELIKKDEEFNLKAKQYYENRI